MICALISDAGRCIIVLSAGRKFVSLTIGASCRARAPVFRWCDCRDFRHRYHTRPCMIVRHDLLSKFPASSIARLSNTTSAIISAPRRPIGEVFSSACYVLSVPRSQVYISQRRRRHRADSLSRSSFRSHPNLSILISPVARRQDHCRRL